MTKNNYFFPFTANTSICKVIFVQGLHNILRYHDKAKHWNDHDCCVGQKKQNKRKDFPLSE